ncbi:hypothetical protein F558DRAFT_00302 [Streptomyces sp. AmelKG-A3]|nr:hypothetical protein GA0115247_11247 [Streptomyces sp. PalvLS-984]SDB89541.1 hypothetical protein F558DRAFT_00302 [Streptomyces sp. AmelKG-A3]
MEREEVTARHVFQAMETGDGAIPALTPWNRRKTRMASQAVRLLPSINA